MNIKVWYHCILTGARVPSEDFALALYAQQMQALSGSGLTDHAELHIAVNGGPGDALLAASLAPKGAILHVNGREAASELATLELLRRSLVPGELVLYFHAKGVSHPGQAVYDRWRRCMERACLWQWRECVQLIEGGLDTVGAHWMHNSTCNIIPPSQKYWGGNFWWSRTDHLLRLPPLARDTWENRYEAEVWIGKSPKPPRLHDFARHFPMNCPA